MEQEFKLFLKDLWYGFLLTCCIMVVVAVAIIIAVTYGFLFSLIYIGFFGYAFYKLEGGRIMKNFEFLLVGITSFAKHVLYASLFLLYIMIICSFVLWNMEPMITGLEWFDLSTNIVFRIILIVMFIGELIAANIKSKVA
jgi:hypothetical protein